MVNERREEEVMICTFHIQSNSFFQHKQYSADGGGEAVAGDGDRNHRGRGGGSLMFYLSYQRVMLVVPYIE